MAYTDDLHSLSHTKWNCKYHIVFVPKYRRKAFYEARRLEVGQMLRQLCEWKGIKIIEAEVCMDHVHMLVEIPPKMSVSDFVGFLKGKSALMIFDKHPEMGSKWDRSFWARGYYVKTIGSVNEETVKQYIMNQIEESQKEDTRNKPL